MHGFCSQILLRGAHMSTMLETTQNAINPESETGIETQSITTQSDDSTIENQLTDEIKTLWWNHVRLSADRKTTTKELRQIRASLAERLYAMKSLLSRPGRGGQWRSWLKERGIPRSSADRLPTHAETLGIENKCAHWGNLNPAKDGLGRSPTGVPLWYLTAIRRQVPRLPRLW